MMLTDEKLRAYAGNELDLPDAGALELMMAAEPDLARRAVFALVERRLAEPGPYGDGLRGVPAVSIKPVPPRFAIAGQPAFLPIGVGLAAAVLCGGIGYLAGQATSPTGPISLGAIENSAMATALGEVKTGGVEHLHDGTFRAVASFITADGTFCREFGFAANSGTSQAVACRHGKDWSVGFALLDPAQGGDYTPADGSDSVGAYLQSLGATQPVSDSVEKDLLERGR
jgi:hypothetical protein